MKTNLILLKTNFNIIYFMVHCHASRRLIFVFVYFYACIALLYLHLQSQLNGTERIDDDGEQKELSYRREHAPVNHAHRRQ